MTRSRRFLSVLALALTGVGCVVGGTSVWRWIQSVRHERVAASREPAALSAWRQRFGDPEAVVAQFTRASDNTTAERLVALARPLGIALENGSENAVPDFPEANAIGRYVNTAGAMTDPSVRIYLDAHRSDVASIVDLLITADRPIWKSTVSSALPLPEPSLNILGARRLNNVLAAAALREASEGRARDADRAAEAAWEVARSARNRPRMVGQLISINLAVADLGIDRRTAVDAGWRSRLDEYDFAGSLEHSIETDAVERILGDDGSMRARAFLADYLDGMRANLERLRTIRLPRPFAADVECRIGGERAIGRPRTDDRRDRMAGT